MTRKEVTECNKYSESPLAINDIFCYNVSDVILEGVPCMKKKMICAFLALVMLFGVIPGVPLVAKAESNMEASQPLIDMLKALEGFSGECKPDGDQRSVGYGTKCDVCDSGMDDYLDKDRECTAYNKRTPMTPETAEQIMRKRLNENYGSSLNQMIKTHNLSLTQQQFDALLSFTYNVGGSWTTNYHGKYTTLYNAVKNGDTGAGLAYAVGLYKTSGGRTYPSIGHIRRRMFELQVYFYGIYETTSRIYETWPENVRFVYLDGNGGQVPNGIQAFALSYPTEILEKATAPTGVDENGNPFTYEFVGWFTQREGGKQVTKLTEAITNGMVLYAHWKNPAGEIVTLPVDTGTVTDEDVTVVVNNGDKPLYEGPGDYYSEVRRMTKYEQLHITKVTTGKDGRRWGLSMDGWVLLSETNYDYLKEQLQPDTAEGTWYKVKVDVVNVRTEHSTENDKNIKYTKVFDDRIKIVETYNEMQGENILRIWGKLTDGNWICMKNGEKDYVAVDENQEDSSGGTQTTPVTGKTITSISLTAPKKDKYELNGGWVYPDLTGGTISIYYDYSTKPGKVVNITRSMISGFDDSVEGVQTVTVTCGGKTATFEVQVVQTIVTSIAVQSMPTKTEYVQNGKETLDLTGGTLLVTYNDGTTAEIPMTGDMVASFDNTQLGTTKVGLKYEDCTTEFDVQIVESVLQSVSMQTLPAKVAYLHKLEALDLSGAVLQLNFSGGIVQPVEITADMVTGFDNTVLGTQTLTVSYGELTTTFPVEIKKLSVVFKNYDGSVISSAEYAYGESVSAPADPTRPADSKGEYEFSGWNQPVVDCTANAEYIAVYALKYPVGDVDRNMTVNEDDAIYLLRHVLTPEGYPIACSPDYNQDGKVNEDDAIYLLRHVLSPDIYPLA